MGSGIGSFLVGENVGDSVGKGEGGSVAAKGQTVAGGYPRFS